MCITEADMVAYNQMIKDAETKKELKEELQYIRDDIASKKDDSDSGGWTLVKKP